MMVSKIFCYKSISPCCRIRGVIILITLTQSKLFLSHFTATFQKVFFVACFNHCVLYSNILRRTMTSQKIFIVYSIISWYVANLCLGFVRQYRLAYNTYAIIPLYSDTIWVIASHNNYQQWAWQFRRTNHHMLLLNLSQSCWITSSRLLVYWQVSSGFTP